MGPLQGIKVLEIAGIGPGPFAAMMLADMGADVVRIDRAARARGGDPAVPPVDPMSLGRRSVARDVKQRRRRPRDRHLRQQQGVQALRRVGDQDPARAFEPIGERNSHEGRVNSRSSRKTSLSISGGGFSCPVTQA